MEIKLEIPWKDFKELVEEMNSVVNEESTGFGMPVRKHKIENGDYYIGVHVEEAYDHDKAKLTPNGKVEITISSKNRVI